MKSSWTKNICFESIDRTFWEVNYEEIKILGNNFDKFVIENYHKEKDCGPFQQVRIKLNVNRDTLQLLEQYVEKRILPLEPITVWKVMHFALSHSIQQILDICFDFFLEPNRINYRTCVRLWKFSCFSDHPIVPKLRRFFVMNFELVTKNCLDFYTLNFPDFQALIENDYLNVTKEIRVWQEICKWIQFKPAVRMVFLENLLNSFRYARVYFSELTLIVKHPLIKNNKKLVEKVEGMMEKFKNFKFQRDGNNRYIDSKFLIARPRIPQCSLIIVGGCTESSITCEVERYSYITNQWDILSFPAKEIEGLEIFYHGLVYYNDKYYIVGGSDNSSMKKVISEIDFKTGRIKELAEMSDFRCYVATVVLGDYIYAFGGSNGKERLNSAERYSPKTNKWTRIADMNVVRSDACACVYKGKIYIAGGLNSLTIEASMECYDPETNTWTMMESMLCQRSSFALVCYKDQLYALGGNDGYERINYVEAYDFHTNQWLPIDAMQSKRSTFQAAVLNDEIYAIAGFDGEHANQTVEKFDYKSQTWLNVGKLHDARTAFSVCCYIEY